MVTCSSKLELVEAGTCRCKEGAQACACGTPCKEFSERRQKT